VKPSRFPKEQSGLYVIWDIVLSSSVVQFLQARVTGSGSHCIFAPGCQALDVVKMTGDVIRIQSGYASLASLC